MANDLCEMPFKALTRLEEILWAELIVAWSGTNRVISVVGEQNAADATGAFLRWFLVEAIPSTKLSISKVELADCAISGDLNLEGARLELQVSLLRCHFLGIVNLNDATIIGLELISGRAAEIRADRLTASGSLQIRRTAPAVDGDAFTIVRQLRLSGAKIRGNLDLRGCRLEGQADGDNEGIVVRIALLADGLAVEGSVLLSDGFSARGEVRLNGSMINRNLDCCGATLTNRDGYSISAAGADIRGSAYFCQTRNWSISPVRLDFTSIGTVRLAGAKIEGDLDCTNGSFVAAPFLTPDVPPEDADRLYAFDADEASIGSNLMFISDDNGDFTVRGAVSLVNAKVGKDFRCDSARFSFPGEELMTADGIAVAGTTFLDEIEADGILRFVQGSFKQGFYVTGARFATLPVSRNWFGDENLSRRELGGTAACGIYAPLAEVEGVFAWRRVQKSPAAQVTETKFWLCLAGARASSVSDDEASWSALDYFDVNGCEYAGIRNLAGYDWRIAQLDRQYAALNTNARVWPGLQALWRALTRRWSGAPGRSQIEDAIRKFKPQPYIQLARTFRSAGYEATSHDVLVHFQRNKTRYSDFGVLRQIGRWCLDVFLLYGFAPFRPLVYLAAWAAVSAVFFQLAYMDGKMQPTKEPAPSATPGTPPRPKFNALIYAIDTLLPIVDFNQKKSWTVELGRAAPQPAPATYPNAVVEVWNDLPRPGASEILVFNTFFGWLMTTLFAAGISGLLRTGREDG